MHLVVFLTVRILLYGKCTKAIIFKASVNLNINNDNYNSKFLYYQSVLIPVNGRLVLPSALDRILIRAAGAIAPLIACTQIL